MKHQPNPPAPVSPEMPVRLLPERPLCPDGSRTPCANV